MKDKKNKVAQRVPSSADDEEKKGFRFIWKERNENEVAFWMQRN